MRLKVRKSAFENCVYCGFKAFWESREHVEIVNNKIMISKQTFGEMIRFAIVGTTAAAIHYAIYWVLQHWINVNVAYTIGYVLSFLVNYYLSAHFTFREHTSARNGVGFGGAHLMNYLLHMVLFNFFLWIGLSRELAPIAVLAIAVPANFLMVRFVFKHFKRK